MDEQDEHHARRDRPDKHVRAAPAGTPRARRRMREFENDPDYQRHCRENSGFAESMACLQSMRDRRRATTQRVIELLARAQGPAARSPSEKAGTGRTDGGAPGSQAGGQRPARTRRPGVFDGRGPPLRAPGENGEQGHEEYLHDTAAGSRVEERRREHHRQALRAPPSQPSRLHQRHLHDGPGRPDQVAPGKSDQAPRTQTAANNPLLADEVRRSVRDLLELIHAPVAMFPPLPTRPPRSCARL